MDQISPTTRGHMIPRILSENYDKQFYRLKLWTLIVCTTQIKI